MTASARTTTSVVGASASATGPRAERPRKRTERRHGCENMFSREQLLSRDLRITGVSKKGTSWRYHIEVLDIRASLTPFLEPAPTAPSSATSSSSTASSSSSTSASSSSTASGAASESATRLLDDTVHPELPPVVRYSVMRRYTDFRTLYLYLVDTCSPEVLESLPPFPDGGLFSYIRGDDPKLLRFRKERLQAFLRALDDYEDTKWCPAFVHFLRPDLEELTTIGGAFARSVESVQARYGSSSGFEISRINTSAGYVSLSMVKSPEIRFKRQPSDGRGDWKRRKVSSRPMSATVVAPKLLRMTSGAKKKLVLDTVADPSSDTATNHLPEEDSSQEESGDAPEDDDEEEEDEDEDHGSSAEQSDAHKPYTKLMRMLSLDAGAA
ncbi:hypothetical protein PINS_up007744 [Pythium insidiosum]|nr:hypothetical protein PINS_up007744 [Pythium insidiosum]